MSGSGGQGGNGTLGRIISAVVIAILVGSTSPWWWNEIFPEPRPDDEEEVIPDTPPDSNGSSEVPNGTAEQPPSENRVIALKSAQNDAYVRAGVGSDSALAAVSSQIAGWEEFEIIGNYPSRFSLVSSLSGKGVVMDNSPEGYLSATCGNLDSCPTVFREVPLQGSQIALQEVNTGKYVRAGIGQNSRLGVASDQPRGWESFTVVDR